MTPARFKQCLQSLEWSVRGLAAYLGLHEGKVRRWASGEMEIPGNVVMWLDYLTEVHTLHPYPQGWEPEYPTSAQMRAAREKMLKKGKK